MKRKLTEGSKAQEVFDKYLELHTLFTRTIKVTKPDVVLWTINKGTNTPPLLIEELGVAKGNLANYCKTLISDKLLVRCRHATQKTISYEITEKGQSRLSELLKKIEKNC